MCIVIIIAFHFATNPCWDDNRNVITFNRLFLQLLGIGGKLGVNCFLLISGYFLISKEKRSMESVVKIWLQMLFYSSLIPIGFAILNHETPGVDTIICGFLPVTCNVWDFASAYFVLMLLVPFYNRLLQTLNKKSYQKMLAVCLVCWCFIPTVTGKNFESNYLIWTGVMYAVGGYIKRFPDVLTTRLKPALLGLLVSLLVYAASVVVFDLLGLKIAFFANNARQTRFCEMRMLPCVCLSISLFLVFLNIQMKHRKWINSLATTVFGVFLIHEQPRMREFVWGQVFQTARYHESLFLVPYTVLAVVSVFLCCALIELLRIHLLEKYYMRPVHRLCTRIESRTALREQHD